MTRFSNNLLAHLGRPKGSKILASCAGLDGADTAAAVSDGCSTSSSQALWGQFSRWPGVAVQQRRAYRHRPNLAKPVDTNAINDLLGSVTRLEHAALPVLQYGAWFDPEQVTRTIQRVPRMLRYQRRKGTQGRSPSDGDLARVMLQQLGTRLAEVVPDCTDEQLARALWAYGASREGHADVVAAACQLLPRRLGSMSVPHLATAAWGLAAATTRAPEPLREPVRQLLRVVAEHLVASRPADLAAPRPAGPALPSTSNPSASSAISTASPSSSSSSDALTPAAAANEAAVAETSGRRVVPEAVEIPPWMDHRSALKLAWAFASAGVVEPQALDVIGDAATARMTTQLQTHDLSSGPLTPRATYIYRTIRGLQYWPRPRPPRSGPLGPRPSRYLRDESPRVVLRDFTLPSLAALLSAFRRMGHRHEGLMKATAQHLVASAGPSLHVAPSDLARVVGALEALRSPQPTTLAALLSAAPLTPLPVPVIARLTELAADWGVRRKAVYGRLVRQLVSRAWVAESGAEDEGSAAAGAGAQGVAAAAAPKAAKEMIILDEEAKAAAAKEAAAKEEEAKEAAAREGAEAEARAQEVRLEPRVHEHRAGQRILESWRAAPAALTQEAREWRAARRAERDRCSAEALARALVGLAKLGYQDPHVDLIRPLFAKLLPALTHMSRDAVANVALAAVLYGDVLDRDHAAATALSPAAAAVALPTALDLIRDATNVVLYGTTTGVRPEKQDLRRRLLELAGYGSGASADVASTDTQAATLRSDLGLTSAGALTLAQALTARPEAVLEKDLKAALSLLDMAQTRRRELGELVARMRQRGRNGALPTRVLAAVGEAPGTFPG